jgi:rubrerythrin
VSTVASRAVAAAKGPLHTIRGTGEQEKMLKNAKTEYSEEHEEIATYTAIEALAENVGDSDTAKLARAIRRDEERMAKFLDTELPRLVKDLVKDEIPRAQRAKRRRPRRRPRGTSSSTPTRTRTRRK